MKKLYLFVYSSYESMSSPSHFGSSQSESPDWPGRPRSIEIVQEESFQLQLHPMLELVNTLKRHIPGRLDLSSGIDLLDLPWPW